MKIKLRLIVLFIYIQINRFFIESTLLESGELLGDSFKGTRSSSFDSIKSSFSGVFTHFYDDTNENLNQNIGLKLDLNDIDLESFTVKDDNYRGYFTKNIKIKDPKRIVTIVDGSTFIHVPRNYEKFIQCTLTINENDIHLKYDFTNSDKKKETLVFYKRSDKWYDSESNPLSEFTNRIFDSKFYSSDRNLLSKTEENRDSTENLDFSNSIEGLYIKFDLDINIKREDEKVDFRECISHGYKSYIYIVKNGYRINKIYEGDEEICNIHEGQRCFYSQVFEVDDKKKVMFTLNNKKDEVVKNHYEKIANMWVNIGLDEFYTKFLENKNQTGIKKIVDLDIRTRHDTDEIMFIDSDFDNVHTHIYVPKLGYTFNKIKIKDYTIWNKRKNECQMVLVRYLDNFPYYIQLMMPKGVSDEYYYMKKKFIKDVVRKFKGTKYDGVWNKIDENKYSSGIAPLKMKPPIKLKSNKFILDINGRKTNDIYIYRHCYPMGLNSYIYMPKDGYKLAMIKDRDQKIWKSPSSEFASFIFVILSDNKPYLVDVVAFDHNIESKHYYFKKLEDIWNGISGGEFNRLRNELTKNDYNETGTNEREGIDGRSNSIDKSNYVNLDLNTSDKTKFVFLQYEFDGMDTIILIPNNNIKIGKVLYKNKTIWKRSKDDCGMVIARLNNGEPYFVNIVKPGNTSDEFYYLTTLKENTPQSNKWKKVEFDHLYAQIKNFRLKPYIQHSYKEYQLDINSKGGDGICYYKCGDFYNIPSCYYITKTGYAITKLIDDNKVLWRSRNGEYSPYVVVLFSEDKPKLIFVMVNKSTVEINETTSIYFKRKGDKWVQIYDDKEFIQKLNEIEIINKTTIEFEMDINQRKDDDKVVFFDDELGIRNVFLYFPRKDYRLIKLTDGNEIIWKTDSKKYIISVKSYLVNDKPYLIRVRYRHPEIRFKNFERVGNKWIEIDSHSYLIKTLTLNDVFFSEVNVIKSSLFNKSITEIGTEDYNERMIEFEEKISISSDSEAGDGMYIDGTGKYFVGRDFDEIGIDNLSIKSRISKESRDRDSIDSNISIGSGRDSIIYGNKEERKYSEDSISSIDSMNSRSMSSSDSNGEESVEHDNDSVLNIIDINFNSFKFSDNMYKNILNRAVEVKYGYRVNKVVEGNITIHKLKDGENLFRCVIYHKDGIPDLVDIFIHDSNKKIAYYIYSKREGIWILTYIKRSDIMYRLYRWLTRPIKKYLTMDLMHFDEENFEKEEKRFARYMYKSISPKPEVSVTRVTYKNEIIHSLKIGQNLTWAFLYEMDLEYDILDLFITESDGRLVCYVYKRDNNEWNLEYSNKTDYKDPLLISTNKFKELINHKLIDSCDINNDLMNPSEQEEIILDIDKEKSLFEYELDDIECKIFKPKKYQKINKIIDEEEIIWENKNESKQLLVTFLYERVGEDSNSEERTEDKYRDDTRNEEKEREEEKVTNKESDEREEGKVDELDKLVEKTKEYDNTEDKDKGEETKDKNSNKNEDELENSNEDNSYNSSHKKKKQKLALYLFLVDYDGNIERVKYYKMYNKWVSEEILLTEGGIEEVKREYELDSITNEEVLEYIYASFNCRFREEWDNNGEVEEGNNNTEEKDDNNIERNNNKNNSYKEERKYSEDSISSTDSIKGIEYDSNTSYKEPKWILDISNVDSNNFSTRRRSVNGQECTEVLPNEDVIVDRLVDRNELIYDLVDGEVFIGSTICLDDINNEYNITYDIKNSNNNNIEKRCYRKNSTSSGSDVEIEVYGKIDKNTGLKIDSKLDLGSKSDSGSNTDSTKSLSNRRSSIYYKRKGDKLGTKEDDEKDNRTRDINISKHEALYNMAGIHVINIANMKYNVCDITNEYYRGNLIKRFKVKKEYKISRIFEGVRLIKISKNGEKILGGSIYYNKGPMMVVLKISSSNKNIEQYVYYKVGLDWMLIENYEITKYLRKLYSEKYVKDYEIERLIGEFEYEEIE